MNLTVVNLNTFLWLLVTNCTLDMQLLKVFPSQHFLARLTQTKSIALLRGCY